jgi:glycine cleavage system aminomethyltransferase T
VLSAYFAERGVTQTPLGGGVFVPSCFSEPRREHLATRRGVGLFDFSFMGWWSIEGPQARHYLQWLQTRNIEELHSGRIYYTLLCRVDGSVLIDATVWCIDAQTFWLFTGRRSDSEYLRRCAATFDVRVTELAPSHNVIAVQGPGSAAIVSRTLACDIDTLPYFSFRHCTFGGYDAWIGRLGYTGETGYEVLVPAESSVALWQRFAKAPFVGEKAECGMEAANSLRIEAGYIHFAGELAVPVKPAQIGLSRLVRSGNSDFIGRAALRFRQDTPETLAGLTIDETAAKPVAVPPDRRRATVRVTSEAYSPLCGKTLALGFAALPWSPGEITYTHDGRRARIARLPFRDPMRLRVRRAPGLA